MISCVVVATAATAAVSSLTRSRVNKNAQNRSSSCPLSSAWTVPPHWRGVGRPESKLEIGNRISLCSSAFRTTTQCALHYLPKISHNPPVCCWRPSSNERKEHEGDGKQESDVWVRNHSWSCARFDPWKPLEREPPLSKPSAPTPPPQEDVPINEEYDASTATVLQGDNESCNSFSWPGSSPKSGSSAQGGALEQEQTGIFAGNPPSPRDAAECFQEPSEFSDLQIYSGTANIELANEVCAHLGISLGRVYHGRFADGEVDIKVLDEVRGRDVFIMQSAPPASSGSDIHTSIMELLLLIAALRRSSARRITAVIPYLSYLRQTGFFQSSNPTKAVPLPSADIVQIMRILGVDGVVFLDLHSQRLEAYFNDVIPVTTIQPQALAVQYFKKKNLNRPVVVATQNTGCERAKAFWTQLQRAGIAAGLATMITNRPERVEREESPIVIELPPSGDVTTPTHRDTWATGGAMRLVGDVNGCDCIIVDDIIDTAERAVNTAEALKAAGANRVFMFATHGVLSKGSIDRINKSRLTELAVTNSISIPPNISCEKLRVISISKLLGEVILRIHHNIGVSSLHRDGSFDRSVASERHQR